MATYGELRDEFSRVEDGPSRNEWLVEKTIEGLQQVSNARDGRNVILYGTAFMQKTNVRQNEVILGVQDINGFRATAAEMNPKRGLALILHNTGGSVSAVETIAAYLHNRFDDIEVIVPVMSMSSGTMLALAGSRLFMSDDSQLGPIDPKIPFGDTTVAAQSILDQFEDAKKGLVNEPNASDAWKPIIDTMGPGTLRDARNAVEFSTDLLASWTAKRMFAGDAAASEKALRLANFFNNGSAHKSHSKRIDITDVTRAGAVVSRMEDEPNLKAAVEYVYNMMSLTFELTSITRLIWTDSGEFWWRNIGEMSTRQGAPVTEFVLPPRKKPTSTMITDGAAEVAAEAE